MKLLMRTTSRQTERQTARGGFTLIELIMTIGIILLLMGVFLAAARSVNNSGKVSATQATIRKVDGLLTRRMEAFERAIIQQNGNSGQLPDYALPWYAAAGRDRDVAMVLGRKDLFRKHFPQRFSEAGITAPAGHSSETESAELLYYMLTEGESFGTEAVDSDSFGDSETRDTDGDGLLEFVDAWGQPLRFYRWPTRLIRPGASGSESDPQTYNGSDDGYENIIKLNYGTNGEGASIISRILPNTAVSASRQTGATWVDENSDPLAKDADDPLGVLLFSEAEYVEKFEKEWHTPSTWHRPLIVSGGTDQALGLLEPYDTSKFGHLAQPDYSNLDGLLDNITNQNLQAGGSN